jgi:glutamyl-tRNA reductase
MQANLEIQDYPKNIFLLGTSYKKLALEERELLNIIERNEKELTNELREVANADEIALISTCNRFEIIAVSPQNKERILPYFAGKLGRELKGDDFYYFDNRNAVRHFFSVASSLDSMVLGEAQILGQVKESYNKAVQNGTAGKFLHHLFQFAFHLAKKIRANTKIAEKGVSISYIAVKLAEQIFGNLNDRSVLIIGSGQMAELAALHLKTHGVSEIVVANRTLEKAIELANKIDASAISLGEIAYHLPRVDVIISSLSQIDKPLITAQELREAKRAKDLFLLDLGVPRNFSASLAEIDDVYLYNIDDLSEISLKHHNLREEAAGEAQLLLDFGLVQFEKWLGKVSSEPQILDMRSKVKSLCRQEVERLMARHIPPGEKEAVLDELSTKISNKISHFLSTNPEEIE